MAKTYLGKTPDEWAEEFEKRHEAIPFKHDYVPTPARWLVEDLFQSGGKLNFVLGQEKAGKSRFIRWLMAHLLSDQQPFGLEGEHLKKILWCGSEESYGAFYTNLFRYGDLIDTDTSLWEEKLVYIPSWGMGLEKQSNRFAFEFGVLKHDPQLIIMDSLRYFHEADEKGGPELTAIINSFRRWTNQYKYNMLINHHSGKLSDQYSDRTKISTWARGDSGIAAVMDCVVALERFGVVGNELADQKVKLYLFGRHAPIIGPWHLLDKGRADKNQAAATDLGWELLKKES